MLQTVLQGDTSTTAEAISPPGRCFLTVPTFEEVVLGLPATAVLRHWDFTQRREGTPTATATGRDGKNGWRKSTG